MCCTRFQTGRREFSRQVCDSRFQPGKCKTVHWAACNHYGRDKGWRTDCGQHQASERHQEEIAGMHEQQRQRFSSNREAAALFYSLYEIPFKCITSSFTELTA